MINSLSDLLGSIQGGGGVDPLAIMNSLQQQGQPQAASGAPTGAAPIDTTGAASLPAAAPGNVLARLRSAQAAQKPQMPQAPQLGNAFQYSGVPDVRGMSKGAALATGLASGLKDLAANSQLRQAQQSQNFQNQLLLYKQLFDMQHQTTEEGIQKDTLAETRRKDLAAEDPALQEKLATAKAPDSSSTWQVLGEDAFGNKKYGYPPAAPKDDDASGGGAAKAAPATGETPNLTDLHGQDFIDELNRQGTGMGDAVKAITEGRFPGAGRNLQKLMPLAAHYEPGFTAQDYQTRLKTANDFDSGQSARAVKAANQTITHAQTALDLLPKLGNYTYMPGIANQIHGMYSGNTDPAYQNNLAQFKTAITGVSEELEKAFRGDRTALGGIQAWKESMDPLGSPESIKGGLQGSMKLLNGAIEALGDQYNRGMKSSKDPVEFLTPRNQAIFKNLLAGRASDAEAPAGEPTGAAPQPPSSAGAGASMPSAAAPAAPATSGTREAPITLEDSDSGRAAAGKLPKGTWITVPGKGVGQVQ